MGRQHDDNFRSIIDIANENGKPVGVNWGSLDQSLVTRLMDENA
jgi:(E)-4-hydroxy-3-methylbut-2-enyl-diphosphate synthase